MKEFLFSEISSHGQFRQPEIETWSGLEWSNGVVLPSQDLFSYIKVISSWMTEKTLVPEKTTNETKLTNFLTLVSV